VRKAASIFLLLLFFVFQYGRILDYMECRIVAAIEATPDCGCDTKLVAATDNNAPAPLHQHSLKNYTEEFFDDKHHSLAALPVINSKQYHNHFIQSAPTGYSSPVFQPPRACFISLS
jgi:hypothetical protein